MVQERKLKVGIARFPYGGNGGTSSEVDDIGTWLLKTYKACQADPRIDDDVVIIKISDTPITMTRNSAVLKARSFGVDVLVMIDSDQSPDCELRFDSEAKPFFESSFDFLYGHFDRGPSVIAAPYCGPPPHENVYIFHWTNSETDNPNSSDMQIEAYTRHSVGQLCGIKEAAALPTGLCMFDMRIFELTEPEKVGSDAWFDYEWVDKYKAAKASTEDVYATRNISLSGMATLGYNPVYCNWDAWAGHWKPKLVRKPRMFTKDSVGQCVIDAVKRGADSRDKLKDVDFSSSNSIDWSSATRDSDTSDTGPFDQAQTPNQLENIRDLIRMMAGAGVPGQVVELGVFRGNTSVHIRKSLDDAGCRDKELHLYDSFSGMPAHSEEDKGSHYVISPGNLECSAELISKKFAASGLVPPEIHEGWFDETLPQELPDVISFALLDSDLYDPIKLSIESVYPRLHAGAVCVIDDYAWSGAPGCRKAIDEFMEDKPEGLYKTGQQDVAHVWFIKGSVAIKDKTHEQNGSSGKSLEHTDYERLGLPSAV